MKKIFFAGFLVFFGIASVQFAYSQVENSMVLIQGGSFLMGSPEDEPGRNPTDEGPQHKVTVNSFYMAKYQVTQAEYEAIMGVNPSQNKGPNHPVERVSWNDAVAYCNRRSIAEGLTPVYIIDGNNVTWNREANGYRLPTESEWEYACRAGTQTPFYSGTAMEDAGWFRDNTRDMVTLNRSTFPVGQKQPNAWGLYDMHGNVLEWCWDFFAPYTASEKVNPTGPATGTHRVFRGGCFDYQSSWCRSAYRFRQHQRFTFFYNGFRVAKNAN